MPRSSLERAVRARVIHEQAPHHMRRDGKKCARLCHWTRR